MSVSSSSTAATQSQHQRNAAVALALVAGFNARQAAAEKPCAAATAVPPSPKLIASPDLGVVIFSKDRAWQLSQLLVSLAQAQSAFPAAQRVALRIAVLYAYSSDAHAASYTRLRSQNPTMEFLDESQSPSNPPKTALGCLKATDCTEATRFTHHLACILHRWHHDGHIRTLLFGVDDMLFYRDDIPFRELVSLLDFSDSSATDDILAVHLALHRGITFCHPANKEATKPPLLPMPTPATSSTASFSTIAPSKSSSLSTVKFLRYLGTRDWNYPFSLAGSMYRVEDVVQVVTECITAHGPQAIAHPNKLEVLGSRIVEHGGRKLNAGAESKETAAEVAAGSGSSPLSLRRVMSCCLSESVMSVITVNRVQEVFQNRIYESQPSPAAQERPQEASPAATSSPVAPVSSSSPVDLSADSLLQLSLAHPRLSFDLARYRAAAGGFNSVHVGEFFTREE
jgi:hypothetical protein